MIDRFLVFGVVVSVFFSCRSQQSIWRDPGVKDEPSFYSKEVSCDKILGELQYQAILHKGFSDENIFNGMIVQNSMIIRKDSAFYRNVYGEVLDNGVCACLDGVLTVSWNQVLRRSIDYQIHFNDSAQVELRYFDYRKDLDYYFSGDSSLLKGLPDNPTKIVGMMRRE